MIPAESSPEAGYVKSLGSSMLAASGTAPHASQLAAPNTRSSHLTGSGHPLEIGFTTAGPELRLTVDPSLPVAMTADRLPGVIAAIMEKSPRWPRTELLSQLLALQQGSLDYGAWLGLRAGGDRFKLYSEVAASCSGRWQDVFPGESARLQQSRLISESTLTMVGFDTGHDSLEFYFRLGNVDPDFAPDLFKPMCDSRRFAAPRSLVESAYGHRLRDRWPGGHVGVSYALDSTGTTTAVTLYFYARSFWGRDSRIRRQFSAAMLARGTDPELYLDLTKGSACNETCLTQHGLLGFVFSSDGRTDLCVGYCPVGAPE